MGEKKQRETRMRMVKQVIVVAACVLFVILMILSGMGSHWLTAFTVAKAGDTVVVDYTFNDIHGNPFLTTSQQTYTQLASKGKNVIYGRNMTIIAGQNQTDSLYHVPVYTGTGGWAQFAIFSTEYNAISQSLIGMKTGDQKHILLPSVSLTQEWSRAQLERNNVSLSDLSVGDTLGIGVSTNPEEMMTNTSGTYSRLGEITSKTDDGIVIDFGYPSVDITIVSINRNSGS